VKNHDRAILADKYVDVLDKLVLRPHTLVAAEAVLSMAEAVDRQAEDRVESPAERPVEKAA
jgi:hypothetical protein